METIILNLRDAEIEYIPSLFNREESKRLFKLLFERTSWEEREILIYGRKVKQPRQMSWIGDTNVAYTYSNTTFQAKPWTPELLKIKKKVEKEAGVEFNSVLLNHYRHGKDSMGCHSDDEPELGKNPIIASVSFGATRIFRLRHKKDNSIPYHDIALDDGSLLIMKGPTQHYWKHEIPKTSKPVGPRINLTFRKINQVKS